MLSLIFAAAFASSVARAVTPLSGEGCDSSQLDVCVERLPPSRQFGIPRDRLELDNHCGAYHVGMGCMDEWISRCMPGDKQQVIGKQTAGARALMALMCNSTLFQKEYLREKACWPVVSGELSRCIDQLHTGALDVAERASRNVEEQLCCVRGDFERCVWDAARLRCTTSAARMLRRMARILASDVASCPHNVRCRACRARTDVLLASALLLCPMVFNL